MIPAESGWLLVTTESRDFLSCTAGDLLAVAVPIVGWTCGAYNTAMPVTLNIGWGEAFAIIITPTGSVIFKDEVYASLELFLERKRAQQPVYSQYTEEQLRNAPWNKG